MNDTTEYHIYELESLGWELTVCNALEPASSPCRLILKRNASYGHLLYDYLCRFISMNTLHIMIGIGGGYGYLTRDFLDRNNTLQATMLDVSPYLLQMQRYILKDHEVNYWQADIMDVDGRELQPFDLAILNENLGDLPTMASIHRDVFVSCLHDLDQHLQRVRQMFDRYALDLPEGELFNVNIGALDVLEKLCRAGISVIFIREHSCEAEVSEPLRRLIQIQPPGNPERIKLRGHDEYTIRFSYLERIARTFQYKTFRGPLADFIAFDFTDKVRYIMYSKSSRKDEHEIIRYFIEDLYQYEYLILMKSI